MLQDSNMIFSRLLVKNSEVEVSTLIIVILA